MNNGTRLTVDDIAYFMRNCDEDLYTKEFLIKTLSKFITRGNLAAKNLLLEFTKNNHRN